MFLLPSGLAAWTGFLLTAILLHYALFAFFRQQTFRIAFTIIGLLLIVSAVVGIASPLYMGLLHYYVRPTNLLIVLVSGLTFLISGLEQPRESLGGRLATTYSQYTQPRKTRTKQRAYIH